MDVAEQLSSTCPPPHYIDPLVFVAEEELWILLRTALLEFDRAEQRRRAARRQEAYWQVMQSLGIETGWKRITDCPLDLLSRKRPLRVCEAEEEARRKLKALGVNVVKDTPVMGLFPLLRQDGYHQELEKELGLYTVKERMEGYRRGSVGETLQCSRNPTNYLPFTRGEPYACLEERPVSWRRRVLQETESCIERPGKTTVQGADED